VKKDGTLNPYIGKKVIVLVDEKQVSNGTIVSSFGSSGKFKVRLEEPLTTFDTKVLSLKLLYKVNSWDKTSAWVQ
jgi:ribosomal protein L35AE/L33A